MKFELLNSLIVIDVEGKKCIVDTGSPMSFALDSSVELYINDESYKLEANMYSSMMKNAIAKLIPGTYIDAIIGNDITSSTNLSIDYLNKELWFDIVECKYDIEQTLIPIEYRGGYIYTSFYLYSDKLDVTLDTGASMSYIKSKYLDLKNGYGEYVDHSPNFGELRGKYYSFRDAYHDELMQVGILPRAAEAYMDGIIAVYPFVEPGYCCFDFKHNLFHFTRRFL
jgi:hypothetical protein